MPFLTVNNINQSYEVTGEGNALLLLHGLGSTKQDWDLQVPVLSKDFKVVTVDLRGHGDTSKPEEGYGVEYMTEDIRQLLEQLNIDKVSLVGFSMGGAVAFQFASDFPEWVDKLVIVNSGPDFNAMGEIGEQLVAERTKSLNEYGMGPLAEQIATNMFPEKGQESMREAFETRCKKNDLNAYYQSFVTLMQWGLGDNIRKITAKTLVIASDMDYTPVAFKEAYVNKLQDAKLVVIENSRHGVVMDQAEVFNNELYKFLMYG
ncbi:alpha/beta fold hydrolase [Formosa sp. S-31]|uniref:alpha/beta fold hydrolase n=1 Tax=Formosa sp. S-31 TaxID=2790949 RepID=UPI003EBD5873